MLEEHPDLSGISSFDPQESGKWTGILRTALRLRRERWDAILVMNPTKLFHVASFLAGIPVRIGYRRKLGFLLTRALPDTKASRNLHESEYNLELARLLGISATNEPLKLPARPEMERRARKLLEERGIPPDARPVALHPWTSNPDKNWPLERFRETARRLLEAGLPIVIIGGSSSDGADSFPPAAVNLAGQTPLGILPSVLRRCSVLISNDSGPVHVAAAVGTPTVVVAPESHAQQLQRWSPMGTGHRILIDPTVEEVVRCCAS